MTNVPINPSRPVRAALYLAGTLATPFVLYGTAKGWLGVPEATLLGSLIAIDLGMATANTVKAEKPITPPTIVAKVDASEVARLVGTHLDRVAQRPDRRA